MIKFDHPLGEVPLRAAMGACVTGSHKIEIYLFRIMMICEYSLEPFSESGWLRYTGTVG